MVASEAAGMKAVLISTYELGHQPFGLASPAAWLRAQGATVTCLDLSREDFREESIRGADLVAFYVPMHTATRLGANLVARVRELNPRGHLCFYGLYAPVNEAYLRGLGVQTILGGEFEAGLGRLAAALEKSHPLRAAKDGAPPPGEPGDPVEPGEPIFDPGDPVEPSEPDEPIFDPGEPGDPAGPITSLERLNFVVPDRAGLPPLSKYAHLLLPDGRSRIAGYTEASRGCKHLCRHCPIVPVYGGVFRVVPREIVLEDIRRQVAAGAQHITFGDPDFFNGPLHGLAVVEALHREWPDLTYDVTIKVEHLLQQEKYLPRLRESGCLFVTSAVESVDDAILARLDKGHTRADFLAVLERFRDVGLVLQPTFVPFSPWTTLEGYRELLAVIAANDLVEHVAPIQLGIRLLIPAGSRLLELEEVRGNIGAFDAAALFYPWRHSDARLDALAERVQDLANQGDALKQTRSETFAQIWRAAAAVAGEGVAAPVWQPPAGQSRAAIPHFTEPWYCCAEPTRDQFVSIGGAAKTPVQPPSQRSSGQRQSSGEQQSLERQNVFV
jgi:radical SAM superfamily enzyme YgiQ (UPF0313 family)